VVAGAGEQVSGAPIRTRNHQYSTQMRNEDRWDWYRRLPTCTRRAKTAKSILSAGRDHSGNFVR
jgi:hypothetical protein